jgi:hypothetical protein
MSPVNIAIAGLGFGAEFIPIYQCHPMANMAAICQRAQSTLDEEGEERLSFTQGAGHGGSHPHLAHHFIEMLISGSEAYPNAVQSANITCTGILGHESAEQGGAIVRLPEFTLE